MIRHQLLHGGGKHPVTQVHAAFVFTRAQWFISLQGAILTYVSLRLDWAKEARRAAALLAVHSGAMGFRVLTASLDSRDASCCPDVFVQLQVHRCTHCHGNVLPVSEQTSHRITLCSTSKQRRRHTPDGFRLAAALARETEQPAPQQPYKEYSDGELDV
jgi:hypothetical protein